MAIDDGFGIDRERRILASPIRDVFTPHRPINSQRLFFGRKAEVHSLIEQMNTPGQHALLYGERGVGKTSLANIAAQILKELAGGRLYMKRCDSTDSFATVLMAPLRERGHDVNVSTTQRSKSFAGEAGVGIPAIKAGIAGEHKTTDTLKGIDAQALSPSWVAEQLSQHQALFVVDEADAISDNQDRAKLAELIKQLSDAGSPFKILVVGIAETGQQLTGGHPSVHRCLRETKLNRMTDQELAEIVTSGAEACEISFTPDTVEAIVHLSAGYPHFTHLLALKCAEEAIASEARLITITGLQVALADAASDAEGTLKRQYDDAVRSFQTDMYKVVVGAAAQCPQPEFTANQLRERMMTIYERDVPQQSLNNYFQRLVSDGEHTIIRRLAKGVYRFNDPRMPSYVLIAEGRLP